MKNLFRTVFLVNGLGMYCQGFYKAKYIFEWSIAGYVTEKTANE